ncbi:MAG: SRPBCC family protein [Candidatus Eisenbacteria bacterium]|nr:SRPBCC family protein [Candidatus Eisenbacteria bacterium]
MSKSIEPGTTEIMCEILIHAPDQDVMRAILDPRSQSTWMQARTDFRAETGAPFRIVWEDPAFPGSIAGTVLDLHVSRRRVLSWQQTGSPAVTQVSLSATPTEGGTLVTLRHSGFPVDASWTGARDIIRSDWEKTLVNLRFFVEEGGLDHEPSTIRVYSSVGAPAERSYQVWFDPVHLTAWWLREARIDPHEGGGLEFVLPDGSAIQGEILLLQKHRHIRWRWDDAGTRSMVAISFWPLDSGSRITLTHTTFGLPPQRLRAYESLWDACFQDLGRYLG